MSSTRPRRRVVKTAQSSGAPPEALPLPIRALPSPSTLPGTSFRKGATFHSPTSPPFEPSDPILHIPSLPKRSRTCPKALDAIVAAGERRMAAFLGSLDRSLSDAGPISPGTQESFRQEDLPLPRGMLDATVPVTPLPDQQDDRDTRGPNPPNPPCRHQTKHHPSDSGIGSTLSGSIHTSSDSNMSSRTHGAVTRSLSLMSSAPHGQQHTLSVQAAKEIVRHIINPILNQATLKDFHPLIRDIPRRINEKEILCLRDLETTLKFLADGPAKSAKSYQDFCETSIQCIITTVDHISERDQCRPTDAPYSRGYFVNLVDQVRQRASEMAASEGVVLVGGLSQTGRPARLALVKDGKTIPIEQGDQSDSIKGENISPLMKRSLSDQSKEDSVRRSMARRRKLAPGEVVSDPAPQVCRDCGKDFKRPCDLTKHEKMHTRPFKCPEDGCKYQTYGWPTEKECDRHVNDKHSKEPVLFPCLYSPCTYKSKRKSNRNQHMEKAHSWRYDRTKGNGKQAGGKSTSATPQTPQIKTPASFGVPTPISGNSPFSDEQGEVTHNAMSASPSEGIAPLSSDSVLDDDPLLSMTEPYDSSFGFDFNNLQPGLNVPSDAANRQAAGGTLAPFNFQDDASSTFHFSTALPVAEEQNLDLDAIDRNSLNDLDSFNAQLMTPLQSTELRPFGSFSNMADLAISGPPFGGEPNHMANLSPGAPADMMLSSPGSMIDQDFHDFKPPSGKDFELYPPGPSSSLDSVSEVMIPNMSQFGGGSSQRFYQPTGLGLSQPTPFDELDSMDLDQEEE